MVIDEYNVLSEVEFDDDGQDIGKDDSDFDD